MERLLTAEEVRRYLRISEMTLWRWRQAGKLVALRTPGGQLRFREEDVQRVLEAEAVPA